MLGCSQVAPPRDLFRTRLEGVTLAHIAIVGGGIAGRAAALFLARRAHTVTVFEHERPWPTGDIDRDFFDWRRPRTPQAIQPHGLLAPVRSVLRREAPDVYAAMLRMGAREHNELDWFAQRPPARAGDDDLVTVRARRIVLERALSDAVAGQAGVDVRYDEPVRALAVAHDGDVPRVTGVRTAGGGVDADLVLDAGGRRSPVGDWLVEAGCRPPVVENHAVGIAYFSRWYRVRPGGPANPGKVWDISISPFAIGLVFPSDNDVFAVTVALPVSDPTRAALRDPAVFDSVARLFPACRAWLALDHEAVGDVKVMAGLDNRWTALVDERGPVVTGLVNVGDSLTHTNPTLGQGAALALLAAQRVATTYDGAAGFEHDYHGWAVRALKPWFDHQVAIDRGDEAFLSGAFDPHAQPPALDDAARAQFAATPCALEDPVVMRARAQVRHLVLTPDQAFGTPEVREHLGRWLERHPEFPSMPPGPSRADWEALTGDPTAAAVMS